MSSALIIQRLFVGIWVFNDVEFFALLQFRWLPFRNEQHRFGRADSPSITFVEFNRPELFRQMLAGLMEWFLISLGID